jgi:hypothetical protein
LRGFDNLKTKTPVPQTNAGTRGNSCGATLLDENRPLCAYLIYADFFNRVPTRSHLLIKRRSARPRKSIRRRARTAFPPPAALCDRAIDRYFSFSTVFMSISQFLPFVKDFIKILWLCAHIILYIPKHTTISPLTNKEKCGIMNLHRNSRR